MDWDYLPATPERTGLCLAEAMEAIIRHLRESTTNETDGVLMWESEIRTCMFVLRAHAMECLPYTLRHGKVELSEMAWHIIRDILTFVGAKVNLAIAFKNRVEHVMQIGPPTSGNPS